MQTINMILTSNLYDLELDGTATLNEDFKQLSRRAAIHSLEEDLEELTRLESDLIADYQQTISYLKEVSDGEYEDLIKSLT